MSLYDTLRTQVYIRSPSQTVSAQTARSRCMHQEASIPKTFVAFIFWYKMLTLFSGNTNRNSGKGFLASHPFLAHLLSMMARLALLAMRSQRILMPPLTACPVVAYICWYMLKRVVTYCRFPPHFHILSHSHSVTGIVKATCTCGYLRIQRQLHDEADT